MDGLNMIGSGPGADKNPVALRTGIGALDIGMPSSGHETSTRMVEGSLTMETGHSGIEVIAIATVS